MRRVRYLVASTLDGFIAGRKGEYDWIPQDPDFDFNEIYEQFDTALMGRRTYEVMLGASQWMPPNMKIFVFSRTLAQSDHPKVSIVADNLEATVTELRNQSGKDIWLFGGGELFRSLAAAKLVDSVETAVMPVLLGEGVPLLPPPTERISLKLQEHKVSPKTGVVSLSYAIV